MCFVVTTSLFYVEAPLIGCLTSERGKMASRALADGEQPILERLKDRFLFPDLSGVVRNGSSTGMHVLTD